MIPCGNENILGRSRVLRAAAFETGLSTLCLADWKRPRE